MVHGLYWLLVMSERAPCLVVVDDANWADEPSLGFLLYLVERVEGLPVTVLVALRPEDAAIAGRPMDRLRPAPPTGSSSLEPLSEDGTTVLILRTTTCPTSSQDGQQSPPGRPMFVTAQGIG